MSDNFRTFQGRINESFLKPTDCCKERTESIIEWMKTYETGDMIQALLVSNIREDLKKKYGVE